MVIEQTVERTIIKKTPDVYGGDACIGNRRIMVWLWVAMRKAGVSDERILSDFDPPLVPSDLEAAWEYYELNRAEIDAAILANETDSDEDE